jgi:hypothetical protein
MDILSVLSVLPCRKSSLEDSVDGGWTDLHEDCFKTLWGLNHIKLNDSSQFALLTPDEQQESVEPTQEPLRTIYEHGTVPGCHDNGIFALIAWYANQDLSWDETKQKLREWFSRTGTWRRGGFSEPSKDEVLEKKKHVWEEAYGWSSMGQAAKRQIEQAKRMANGPNTTTESPSSEPASA